MDKTHWFPVFHGIKSAPIKVVCNCEAWDILAATGFVKNISELPESREEKNNDDKDSGENWELIKDLSTKDEVEQFVKDMTGIDLDKRGSLDTVKEKALVVLNECVRINS